MTLMPFGTADAAQCVGDVCLVSHPPLASNGAEFEVDPEIEPVPSSIH